MKYSISEILEAADSHTNIEDKAQILRQNDSTTLRDIFIYTYHPNIEFLLPKGLTPNEVWTLNKYPDSEGVLYTEIKKFYLFVKGGNDRITPLKREQLWINLLEKLDAKDAILVQYVKDKSLPYPGITPEVINLAFPELLPKESMKYMPHDITKSVPKQKKKSLNKKGKKVELPPLQYENTTFNGSSLPENILKVNAVDTTVKSVEVVNDIKEMDKLLSLDPELGTKVSTQLNYDSDEVPIVSTKRNILKTMPQRDASGKFLKKDQKV